MWADVPLMSDRMAVYGLYGRHEWTSEGCSLKMLKTFVYSRVVVFSTKTKEIMKNLKD